MRERVIGRGGMGTVWLGRDTVLGRQVAMKRVGLVPGGSAPDLERAEREARLAAALSHPHVVAVYDLVAEGDEHWLVMEYVEGESLAALIRRDGPLPAEAAASILEQVADALAAAHAHGIVHRDVKPSNIMVSPHGHAKLTDFGIAKAEADASLTQTGLVTGSPAYLAPEVASGASATPASDVWALGATLFHALAGRPPYDVGDNVLGALYKIVHEAPPRLDGVGWPASVLHHTMATDPADRWEAGRVRDFLRAGEQAGATDVPTSRLATTPAQRLVDDAAGDGAEQAAPSAPTEHTAAFPPVTAPPARAPRAGTRQAPAPAAGSSGPTTPEQGERAPSLAPAGGRDRPQGRTPRWVWGAAAAVVVLLLGGGLGLSALNDQDDPDGQDSPAADPGTSAPSDAEEGTTAPSPAPTPTPSPSAPSAPDPQAMEAFVAGYLDTVTSDPRVTWQQLTPAFQEQSGGFGRYNGFWRTVEDAEVVDIAADPDALTVTYTVRYVLKRGGSTTDSVTLSLEPDADGFQVAGES